MSATDLNLGAFLAKRATRDPGLEALVDAATGRRYTYAELDASVDRTAAALAGRGVHAGDRVATLLMNGPEFVETFYGTAKLGAVVVALNWRLVADELEYILGDSGATVLVFDDTFREVAAELHRRGSTKVEHWIHAGEEANRPDGAVGYEDLRAAVDGAPVEPVGGGGDLLFIMYTSGTTGLPKGVMHSHDTTAWSLMTATATADVRYGDRYLICLPLFHVGALNPLLTSFYVGGTAVLMREFDPRTIWDVFATERITTSLAVPAMLNFMAQTFDPARAADLSQLRWIMSGASPVPVSLIEQYAGMGIEVHQVYGLTESGGPACLISPDDAIAHAGSTGKAFFHTDVRVVDKKGNDVPPGEPGEVIVRGRHIMVGYWNQPEATAETVRDGWLHTGDVAIVDEDGFVTIHDRIKDMIISGGENVYPAEIEDLLLRHPGVADVAVIGVPSDRWGESPMAIVVRASEDVDEASVLQWCDGRLARFKLPKAVAFTDTIPRNATGKVLKRVLREEHHDPVGA
ncbi:MAG: long-chain-fatty-acid--CoA ligase [Actinomycetota bacterium]|nr:long-chain-fatty-acid--CoA ligase [Actinomycetota bacterium]